MTDAPPPASTGRVVVLASGSGTLLQALLDAGADRGFAVVAVGSDRPDATALERARTAGVPTALVEPGDFAERATWDQAVARSVEVFKPDLVVLAGFMRLLGEPFLDQFGSRTLNTHPALLPAFPGAHAVRDALAYGVKVTGCSVILVDAGTDTGPVVAQRAVQVLDSDDEPTLHERIKVVERELLVDITHRLATQPWRIQNRKVAWE